MRRPPPASSVQRLASSVQPSNVHQMDVFADFRFEAAHQLPGVPREHRCARMHGHSFEMRIVAVGEVDEGAGWVLDFGALAEAVEPVRLELDHRCLNHIPGLSNPTCENLAIWVWQRLQPKIPGLSVVEVREMAGLGCIYRGARSVV